ncbi:MAG: T9SS type A sorting domain-containing protein [Flavobacteriales bacterium]|jgi:hypothetical protein|nr:T9SS type A sorting domain-containing protein [Flavobacteriales bacterium]
MRKSLLLTFLGLMGVSASAQVVGVGPIAIHLSTAADTFYTNFQVNAGVKVTGHTDAIYWVDTVQGDLNTTVTGVTQNSEWDSVILKLSDNMQFDLSPGANAALHPKVRGGLFIGTSTELLNNDNGTVHDFPYGQQYRYEEQFIPGRTHLFTNSTKDARRNSLRVKMDTTDARNVYSIHFWDNKTESYVTGFVTGATNTAGQSGTMPLHTAVPAANSGDSIKSYGGTNDITSYNAADDSYQHHIYEDGLNFGDGDAVPNELIASSPTFDSLLNVDGRGYAIRYGSNAVSYDANATKVVDSVYSVDGFFDGNVVVNVDQTSDINGRFSAWHMIGNPYRQALNVLSFIDNNTTIDDNDGFYGDSYLFAEGTVSIYTDIDKSSATTFNPGFVVINKSGDIVGINDQFTGASPSPSLDLLHTSTTTDVTAAELTTVAPGQAFFIWHRKGNANVTFQNSMRVDATDEVLTKEAQEDKLMIYVDAYQVHENEKLNVGDWGQLAITIDDEVNPRGYNLISNVTDFEMKDVTPDRSVNIYTQDNHKDQQGTALRVVRHNMVNKLIPMGFDSRDGDAEYVFHLSKDLNNDKYDVYVVDRALNVEAKISDDEMYRFRTFERSAQQNRFFLKFKHKEDESISYEPEVYFDGQNITVDIESLNAEIQEMSIIDVTGRLIKRFEPGTFKMFSTQVTLKPGVYFVRTKVNDSLHSSKIVKN